MFLCVIVLVIYFRIPQVLGIKFLFPTSGIRALVRVRAMTGEDGKTSRIEKFDGTDFRYWKMQIEDYVWYKLATGAHKYDYEKKYIYIYIYDDLSQRMFSLIKVELFQKE